LVLSLLIGAIIIILRPFFPWAGLFNSQNVKIIEEGSWLFVLIFLISSLNLSFLVNTVGYFSYQESFWNAFFIILPKVFSLFLIILCVYLHASFFYTTLIFFLVHFLISIGAFYVFLGKRKWKMIFIKFKTIYNKARDLFKHSCLFAVLQFFSTVYASIDIFLISKIIGLEATGNYSLVKKLYILANSLQFSFLMPVWSAYTEAIESKDFNWVESTFRRSIFYTLLFFTISFFIFISVGDKIVYLWSGRLISDKLLYFLLGIWSLFTALNSVLSVFLNSQGILKGQILSSAFGIAVLMPLSVYYFKAFGINGICISLIISLIPPLLFNFTQSILFLRSIRQTY
jgi:O-antigen/teichoic acid export membrane protein